MSDLRCFSASVPEATEKFVSACDGAGISYVLHENPCAGPEGERLNCVEARVGPKREAAARVIFIISGTHGIEAYAGMAIQTEIVRSIGQHDIPEDTALVFIHNMNPWGAAWNRRENENNVDLFRNLVYRHPPFYENPSYEIVEEGINPRHWEGPERERADRILDDFVAEHGSEALMSIIRCGQHRYPRGMTYHGNCPTWSRLTVEDIIQRHLGAGQHVVAYDIHTGYGPYGMGQIMTYDQPGSAKHDELERAFGDVHVVGADPFLPAHPGAAYDFIPSLMDGGHFVSVPLEFGTYDVTQEFETFRANSFIHNYGDPLSPFGRATSKAYRRLFYPEKEDWKEAVLARGLMIFDQIITHLR